MARSSAAREITKTLTGELSPVSDDVAEKVLEAAFRQILEYGLRRITIDDVAGAAHVSRITVYRRFPNKDTLIRTLLLRECRRFVAELDAAVPPSLSAEDRLIEGFAVALRNARKHPLISRLLVTDAETLLPYATINSGPALAIARGFLSSRIRSAQEDGAFPRIDADQVAEVLVRLAASFVLIPDSYIPLSNDEQMRAFARRFIVPLLGASRR